MALIKCSECGKQISDKAKQCIHCGAPIEIENEINKDVKENNKNKEAVSTDKNVINNTTSQNANNNSNNTAGGIIGLILLAVIIISALYGAGVFDSDKKDTTVKKEEKTETILSASKLSNTFSSESKKESIYGGTVHNELQFKDDGKVFWGMCYSKTGKCTGFTYTYTKTGLDVIIYNNSEVQYSCYFNSNSDRTLYCKHHNGYSYENYSRIN